MLGGPSGAAEGVAVTVDYTTNDGSALAGTDYTTTSGTLTFPPGETAQNISVPILDRSGAAATRSFSVTLSTPTNATVADAVGVVTIGASGAPAVSLPEISAPPNVVVGETDGYVDLPVTLNAPGESTVTVNYSHRRRDGQRRIRQLRVCQLRLREQERHPHLHPRRDHPGRPDHPVELPHQPRQLDVHLRSDEPGQGHDCQRRHHGDHRGDPGSPRGRRRASPLFRGTRGRWSASPLRHPMAGIRSIPDTVTASPGGETASGVSSPITVTGLTNGTSYTFTVAATNDVGTGSSSSSSNAVTPAVILITPTTPTISNLPASGAVGGGFTATVSTNGDGTTSVTSNATSVCTVSGFAVTYVGVGTCSLTAHVAAGTNYAAANGTAQTFTITAAPAPYSPLAPVRICGHEQHSVSGLTGAAAQCNGNTIAAGTVRTINVANSGNGGLGSFGVPATATAVMLNVTVVDPAGPGHVTISRWNKSTNSIEHLITRAGENIPETGRRGRWRRGTFQFCELELRRTSWSTLRAMGSDCLRRGAVGPLPSAFPVRLGSVTPDREPVESLGDA